MNNPLLRIDPVGSLIRPCLIVFFALTILPVFAQEKKPAAKPLPALSYQRSPSWFNSSSEPLTPQTEILLRFNEEVKVEDVAKYFSFLEKKTDRRLPVEAARPTLEETSRLQQYKDDKPTLALERFVKVTPVSALPVDSEWRLESRAGMTSKAKTHAINTTRSDYLGQLAAFKIKSIEPETPYDEPRYVRIRTTKYRLQESFTPELLSDYITVEPAVEDLTFEPGSYGVVLNGKFESKRQYKVTVKPGLIASDRTNLAEGITETITLNPNPGFVSLPSHQTAQNASGNRSFQIMTGNLHGVQVRVKKLSSNELVYALRGYEAAYQGEGDQKRDIPYEMVPGKTIYDQTYKRTAELDHSEKFKLSWNTLTGGDKLGAYYVCAEGRSATRNSFGIGAQSLIQLTDIGLSWKQDGKETLFYAFSIETGKPAANVDISLITDDVESVRDIKTDVNGIARVETGTLTNDVRWLDASRGDDRHVMRYQKKMSSMGLYGFSIPYHHYGQQPPRRTLIFSDRPVYKPGETVHFKVISRLADSDAVLDPDAAPATLKIFDVQNRIVVDEKVSLSKNGTYDGSFTLPKTGLGFAEIQVDFNQTKKSNYRNIFRESIRVAEYKPNTFEVNLETAERYTLGEQIEVPVRARYYMGKPLSKAKLSWQVSASRLWEQPGGFENFHFYDAMDYPAGFNRSEEIHLSETGETAIKIDLPKEQKSPMPVEVSLSTEITDINQQTISDSKQFIAHSSDFYLGMQLPSEIVRAGEPMSLGFVAVNADGSLHTEPVEASLKIEKRTWNTVKVKGAGGRVSVRNDETRIAKSEEPVEIRTKAAIENSKVPQATVREVSIDEPGDFILTVTARDAEGRDIVTRKDIRIIGADEPSWAWRQMQRVDLLPDKTTYKVGETARLLLRSPVFGHALITTERAGVRQTVTRAITEHETVLEIPIKDGDAPNIFASVFLVRGSSDSPHKHPEATYRVGYCQMKVDDPGAKLDVAVQHKNSGEGEFFIPGEPVEVAALITDSEGNPAQNTEVTFYAVDEGVLSLMGYETPNPAATFDRPFPLIVRTGQSLSNLLEENETELTFQNKGYVIGGGGEMGGPDLKRVRKDFKALAFWEGALKTGNDGKVKATFVAPDNLTTFRVMAVAVRGNQFGSGESDVTVNKPLIIEPSLPRFSNVADQVDLTAVLYNNTTKDLDLMIEVELDRHATFLPEVPGLMPTKLDSGELDSRIVNRRFTIGAGKTERLGFPVAFTKIGEAKWTWKATSVEDNKLTDATESKLMVGYPIPILRDSKHISINEASKHKNALADIPPRLLNGTGVVKVSLSNSRIHEASDAIEYLLKYPYGCLEQTSSSTLPWLSTQNMRQALPAMKKTEAEIAEAIQTGAERLLTMQTRNGGLSYWPGGNDPVLWGSAYGGMVLALADKSGATLPKDRLDRLWEYLSGELRDTKKLTKGYDLSQRCLAAYTLAIAGAPEDGYINLLYDKRAEIPREGRALLALAMMESARAGGATEYSDVIKKRVPVLLADNEDDPDSGVRWYGQSYTNATRLMAWSMFDIENNATEQTMTHLLALRKPGVSGWGSTYSNAWPMLALAKHTEASGTSLADAKCIVKFGDEEREITFTSEPSGGVVSFELEGDQRETDLKIEVDTSAKIFANVRVESQPKIMPFAAENHGFTIERKYQEIDPDGTLHEANDLTVGDLILVSLRLNLPNKTEHYLAIDDPLPSVFEAINPDFKTQAAAGAGDQKAEWPRLWAHHKELRTDRALFFADYVYRAGDYSIQYLARVVSSGDVTAPPAKIEAMYEPSRYGLSATQRITAKPLNFDKEKLAAK